MGPGAGSRCAYYAPRKACPVGLCRRAAGRGWPDMPWPGRVSVFVVQPGEPGREPVDRRLELRRDVHEFP